MPAKKKTATKRQNAPKKKKSAARKRAAPSLAGALAEAAWADADRALAEALVESDQAETASDAATREAAVALMIQALSRAGRKRGLQRIGLLGDKAPYDPAKHQLIAAVVKKPRTVRIAARGVARGSDILERPRVGPVTRGRRKSGQ